MAAKVITLNLKEGYPTVEQARARLKAELDRAAKAGVIGIKVIHGYGSSGVGGSLREAVRRSLKKRRKEGRIRAFVPGEKWDLFDLAAREVLEACPALGKDPDLNRYNEGVTVVLV